MHAKLYHPMSLGIKHVLCAYAQCQWQASASFQPLSILCHVKPSQYEYSLPMLAGVSVGKEQKQHLQSADTSVFLLASTLTYHISLIVMGFEKEATVIATTTRRRISVAAGQRCQSFSIPHRSAGLLLSACTTSQDCSYMLPWDYVPCSRGC